MNETEFALKLIQDYNTEHNKYRRARDAVSRLQADNKWHTDAFEAGISCAYIKTSSLSCKEASKTFVSRSSNAPMDTLFVSSGAKNGRIRQFSNQMKNWEKLQTPYALTRTNELKITIEAIKKASVNAELGKKWQQLVLAQHAADEAYKSRWQVRCAIAAFNKIKSGLKIKFGNCSRGGGSMSYIRYVEIDGFNIKLAKFLDNALFETAILNG